MGGSTASDLLASVELPRRDIDRSEERFPGAFDQSPLGGLILDGGLRILQSNLAIQRLLGRRADELIGQDALAFAHLEDREEVRREVVRLFTGDVDEVRLATRCLQASGEAVSVRLTASLVRDEVGNPRYGIALVEDITAAVEASLETEHERERLTKALEAGNLAVWELDLVTGVFTMWDHAESASGGLAARPAPDFTDFLERVVPEDRHLFLEGQPAPGESFAVDYRVDDDGEITWRRSQGRAVGDANGRTVALRGTTIDVTATREAEAEAAAVFRRTVEVAHDAFVGADAQGRITDWNPAAEQMFGWPAEEVLGELMVDHVFVAEDRPYYQDRIEALSASGADQLPPVRFELPTQHRDGTVFPVELSLVVVTSQGRHHMRAFLRDIGERRAHERDRANRVLVDQMTGLPNRALLVDRLEQAMGRGTPSGAHAVLFIDLDRFKSVNEVSGHGVGDAVLAAVAGRLCEVVRPDDTVARHGGDEFIVLCENLTVEADAAEVAERILDAFSRPLAVAGRRFTMDLSIGVAVADRTATDAACVIRHADIAMQHAKALGGARVEVFEPEVADRSARRLDLEQELRRGLSSGQVGVVYQPVVTFGGRLVSMEALARWEHPELGPISPAEFIPVAEQTGLIVDLGARVLNEACGQLAEWRNRPGWERLTMAANLSGRQLTEPDLVSTVSGILATHDLPIDAICLEITESMLMDDSSRAAATVDELAELGVVLAVDDFGTGYSSLLYLRRFPVHALKLDWSFVAGIGTNRVDTAIVASMVDLARALRLVSIAEGVETQAQAEALQAQGCDLAQGHHWAPPLSAEAFGRLLDDSRFT